MKTKKSGKGMSYVSESMFEEYKKVAVLNDRLFEFPKVIKFSKSRLKNECYNKN